MSQFEYKVVPFIGKIGAGENAGKVSAQLQSLIDTHASDGWELHLMGDVNIQVSPGCLGALFGAKAAYVRFDQIIFRKAVA